MTDRISIPALRRYVAADGHATPDETLALVEAVEAAHAGWRGHGPHCERCGAPTLDARTPILAALARFDFGENE